MSNVDTHREAHRTFTEQGAEAAAVYFAPDISYTDEARGLTLKTKAEVTGWLAEWKRTYSDASINEATYLDTGEWTIARFQGRGTNDGPFGPFPASGRRLDAPFCELLRWTDGKAIEGAIYYDAATILVQLGHMEPPPSS
jgi:steroid delta-isomerase-like uncharacterized protein